MFIIEKNYYLEYEKDFYDIKRKMSHFVLKWSKDILKGIKEINKKKHKKSQSTGFKQEKTNFEKLSFQIYWKNLI